MNLVKYFKLREMISSDNEDDRMLGIELMKDEPFDNLKIELFNLSYHKTLEDYYKKLRSIFDYQWYNKETGWQQ